MKKAKGTLTVTNVRNLNTLFIRCPECGRSPKFIKCDSMFFLTNSSRACCDTILDTEFVKFYTSFTEALRAVLSYNEKLHRKIDKYYFRLLKHIIDDIGYGYDAEMIKNKIIRGNYFFNNDTRWLKQAKKRLKKLA